MNVRYGMTTRTSQFAVPVKTVIRSRARSISLRLDHAEREAQLILPHGKFLKQGQKLLHKRSSWLEKQWQNLPPPMPFQPGQKILLAGNRVLLIFEQGRGSYELTDQGLMVPALRTELFANRVRRALVDIARKRLRESVGLYARHIGVTPGKITVRDTKSRWGSCSPSGNLNFSWRLVCAPDFVLCYVAAHEVAHIKEPHHGPAFWALVRRSFGDPSAARKYLRDNAPNLFAVGAVQ